MFINSIKWRLQIWHGLILVAVLAGFGVTAYQLERGSVLSRVDEELEREVGKLLGGLRGGGGGERGRPPGPGPGPGRGQGRPDFGERPPPPGGPQDGPPGWDDGPPPPRNRRPPPGIESALADATNGFYYVVWMRDGNEIGRSHNAEFAVPAPEPAKANSSRSYARQRGLIREMYHFTPPGECVLAGKVIETEMAGLHRFGFLLAGAGGGVLLLGLAGGWWFTQRAMRPIEDISATARRISGGNLAERINVADTDNELGQLAGVLNTTFARLEATFEQQQQFTSDAAHELRTPVTVVLTQTQTALSRERSPEDYRATLEACQRAAQRMRRLTESLLELARLDAGQAMKRERFDCVKTVNECLEFARPQAAERKVEVQFQSSPAFALGDADRYAQVVTNLLSNAIHYNKEGGEVRVNLANGGGEVVLTVADTGRGIGAEDLPHIFERFYRADKSRAHASGRTGLGLAIVKSIVDAQKGTIEVVSKLGVGTTFTVKLPAAKSGSQWQ